MNYPKISVVTPSYNQGAFLEETILSILNQNYPNLEFIIIDGGSTDQSVDIIRKYEKDIAYWVSEKDRGQSHAMNKGIEKSTGDILTTIFSDDLLTPGALHKVAELFNQADSSVSIIHGSTVLFNSKGDIKEEPGYPNPSFERYLSGLCFSHTAGFVRRNYLNYVGNYNEKRHFGMDYDLYSRLLMVSRFQRVEHIFSKYRFHDESKTVALSSRFTNDWIQSFVNLAVNNDLHEVLVALKEVGVFNANLEAPDAYEFTFEKIKPDQRRMVYYFLSDIMRADYRTQNYKRAARLARYLSAHFDLQDENDVRKIAVRLKIYPAFLLASAKKLKGWVK